MSKLNKTDFSGETSGDTRDRLEIPVRKVKFDYSGAPSESAAITHFLHILSLLFPDGEQFFVDSVKPYRGKITNPKLKEEVRRFIGQEAHHGHQHDVYNDFLAQTSPLPTKRARKVIKSTLQYATKVAPPMVGLSFTAAAEHFTAILAELLLSNEEFAEFVEPDHRKLWLWHAVEENEHKSVVFDVFKEMGGGYFNRVSTLTVITIIGIPALSVATLVMLAADGKFFSIKEWRTLRRFLFNKEVGLFPNLWRPFLSYYKRDFHPWQHDTSELINDWKKEYEEEALVSYLVR